MKWTKEDEQLLTQLYLINRKTAPDIAIIMGRDKGSVRNKITRMNLCSPVAIQYI